LTILEQRKGLSPAEHLAAIVESSDDAIASKDLNGIIQSWNKAAERVFGYSAEEIIGRSVLMLIPVDRHHEEDEILARIRGGERIEHFETVRQRKDGTLIDISLSVSPVKDTEGKIIGASKIARDITDKKRAELRLVTQRKRLEILHRVATEISRDLDLRRIVQSVTDLATEVSGARFGSFFYNMLDQNGEWYSLYTLSGAPREAFERFGMPRNTAVFDPTFKGEGIVRSDDIRQDPRYGKNDPHFGMPKGHLPVVSYLAVPVVSSSGQIHGGLFFGHDKPGVFTEDVEILVSAIAAQAAVAMDNARLHHAAQREIEERRKAEAVKELLVHEIKHRVKNTLGTIQAMVMQTFRSADREEHATFVSRLHALSDAHDLLTQRNWQNANLQDVVERAVAPFNNGGKRIVPSGPGVELSPSKALVIAMLLHELGTNAVKYGALSTDTGHVALTWQAAPEDNDQRLSMIWTESDGPEVKSPSRKGFGSRMIERALQAEGGSAKLEFEPRGLICRIELTVPSAGA
jgi:PAS domain S-box-containing protein